MSKNQIRKSEKDVSATRVRPDQMEPSEGQHPPTHAGSDGQTHMGAVEDQVIREKPPTDILDKLLDSPGDEDNNHASNDELTPG